MSINTLVWCVFLPCFVCLSLCCPLCGWICVFFTLFPLPLQSFVINANLVDGIIWCRKEASLDWINATVEIRWFVNQKVVNIHIRDVIMFEIHIRTHIPPGYFFFRRSLFVYMLSQCIQCFYGTTTDVYSQYSVVVFCSAVQPFSHLVIFRFCYYIKFVYFILCALK